MQSKDWKNINQIFRAAPVKKGPSMDEVEWDKLEAMNLEERRMALLSEYNPDEEQEQMGQNFQENGREAQEKE
jgi:hypothetical protein